MTNEPQVLQEARASLARVQDFDPDSLVREKDLGASLNFRPAVEPARRLIELWKRLAPASLEDFPDQQLQQVKQRANQDFSVFQSILDFKTTEANPHDVRQSLVKQVEDSYQPTFQLIHPLVAYSLHRSADFQRLESEARATLQEIRDKAEGITSDLETTKEEAAGVLAEVRKVAAEAGVSQQAIHFQTASEDNSTRAEEWKKRTINLAWSLGAFAVASFFIHKIPFLAPETGYDTVQLAVSKLLVFGVLSYMLYLSARNFMSHKHNAVVNKHRQDALVTYRALVEAAEVPGNRDVVLTYAAACIFGPQPTGYIQTDGSEQTAAPRSVVELLSRQLTGND